MNLSLPVNPKVVNFSPSWHPLENQHCSSLYPFLPTPPQQRYPFQPSHHYHHNIAHPPHFPHIPLQFLIPPSSPFNYYPPTHHFPPFLPPDHPFHRRNEASPPILANQVTPNILSQIQFPIQSSPQPRISSVYVEKQCRLSKLQEQSQQLFKTLLEDNVNFEESKFCEHFKTLPLIDQLQCFLDSQTLQPDQLRIRWQIAFDTLYILRQHFPLCQVLVFGSLLTGLGTINSDIDMYVDLLGDDGRHLQQQKYPELVASLMRDEVNEHFLQKSKCPHSNRQYFALNTTLMGTRVPFIRFSHGVTDIMCDLSFGSRISVQNSRLLLFYLNYDPRVGPLLIFLRYWAKFHGISGEKKIKQYALALMALVYLMKIGILPCVNLLQFLQENRILHGITRNPDKIGEWNASFCDDRGVIDQSFRSSRIPTRYPFSETLQIFELALNFFEMYAELDMSSNVICASIGDIVSKKEFYDTPKGDGWMFDCKLQKFWSSCSLSIQDPFVLTFNVGGIAKEETVKEFQEKCRSTFQKLKGRLIKVNQFSILDFFLPINPE